VKPLRPGLALVLGTALCACAPSEDRSRLIGSYSLVVPAEQPKARKDFVSSELRLTPDGMFTQQCRYRNGIADSAIGTWSYSKHRAQFSVFKDCAGVLPAASGRGQTRASFAVEFDAPTRIVLSSRIATRYERRGAP